MANSRPSSPPVVPGIRVLLVDGNPVSRMNLERSLTSFHYIVTSCSSAEATLDILLKNRDGFDIVLTDANIPNMDGFTLLGKIKLETDVPVAMLTAENQLGVTMRGLREGALFCFTKPPSMNDLKNIWQHVLWWRRRRRTMALEQSDDAGWRPPGLEEARIIDDDQEDLFPEMGQDTMDNKSNEKNDDSSEAERLPPGLEKAESRKEGREGSSPEMGQDGQDENSDRNNEGGSEAGRPRRHRLVWNNRLHAQFLQAIESLGGMDRAVPKAIQKTMKVPGLTRENIASHLQKYRLRIRKEERRKRDSIRQHISNRISSRGASSTSLLTTSTPARWQQSGPLLQAPRISGSFTYNNMGTNPIMCSSPQQFNQQFAGTQDLPIPNFDCYNHNISSDGNFNPLGNPFLNQYTNLSRPQASSTVTEMIFGGNPPIPNFEALGGQEGIYPGFFNGQPQIQPQVAPFAFPATGSSGLAGLPSFVPSPTINQCPNSSFNGTIQQSYELGNSMDTMGGFTFQASVPQIEAQEGGDSSLIPEDLMPESFFVTELPNESTSEPVCCQNPNSSPHGTALPKNHTSETPPLPPMGEIAERIADLGISAVDERGSVATEFFYDDYLSTFNEPLQLDYELHSVPEMGSFVDITRSLDVQTPAVPMQFSDDDIQEMML